MELLSLGHENLEIRWNEAEIYLCLEVGPVGSDDISSSSSVSSGSRSGSDAKIGVVVLASCIIALVS